MILYRKVMRILLLIAILSLLCTSAIAASDDSSSQWAVSYTTYDTTYDAIIKMYIKVMSAHCRNQSRGRHDLYNELLYYDCPEFADWDIDKLSKEDQNKRKKELQEEQLQYMKNHYGYAILDLNGDGIDELIIGGGKSEIYELFTMDNGRVRELVRGGGRYSCHLLQDGSLLRYFYDGGGYYGYELYKMNGVSPVKFVEGFVYDWVAGYSSCDEDDYWFAINSKSGQTSRKLGQHIGYSVVKQWADNHESQYANIPYIPFAAYEKGIDGDGVAVLSVKGKTSGTSKVRVRSKADSKSKIIVEKKVGTYVNVIEAEGDYYKITVDKKTGYVHKDYLTLYSDVTYDFLKLGSISEKPIDHIETYYTYEEQGDGGFKEITHQRPVYYSDPDILNRYYSVLDHYETVSVDKTRRVIDHFETFYTYEDNGDGTFDAIPHERAVYSTQHYTEDEQVPVYKLVPKEKTEK